MRKILAIALLISVSSVCRAQDGNLVPPPPINWMDYLSESETKDLLTRLSENEQKRLIKEGTLFDENRRRGSVSIPVYYYEEAGTSEDDGVTASAISTGVGVGTINCSSFRTDEPHLGDISGQLLPKAKAGGTCYYVHLNQNFPQPAWIGWTLWHNLTRYEGGTWVEYYTPKVGLNVTWQRPNYTVHANECLSGTYTHFGWMILTVPPGYTAANPVGVDQPRSKLIDC